MAKWHKVPRMRAKRKSERRLRTDSENQYRRVGYGEDNEGDQYYGDPYYTSECGKHRQGERRRRVLSRFKKNAARGGGRYFKVDEGDTGKAASPEKSPSPLRRDSNGAFERTYGKIPSMSGRGGLKDEREKRSKKRSPAGGAKKASGKRRKVLAKKSKKKQDG